MIRQYITPPIQHQDGSLAVDNQKKQKALCKKLFTPPTNTGQGNIKVSHLQEETKNSPVDWHACAMHKIEATIFQAGNTLAGSNGILLLVIKKV